MAEFPISLKQLCPPAAFYFVVSVIALIVIAFQNLGNSHSYHVGSMFSCRVPSTALTILCKLVFIMFWTYVLNLICRDGHSGLSWFLVLLPWVVLLIMMFLILINA